MTLVIATYLSLSSHNFLSRARQSKSIFSPQQVLAAVVALLNTSNRKPHREDPCITLAA